MLDYGEPPRRRRWIGPVIGLLIFFGLIAGAGILADSQLRTFATGAVTAPLAGALGVDQSAVSVDFGPGLLITQLPSGKLETVTVDVAGMPVGPASPSLLMTATGVPLSTSSTISRVVAELRFSSADMQPLATAIGGDAATGIALADGAIEITSEQKIAGAKVPIVVRFAPAIDAGVLRLTVVGLVVDGDELDLDKVSAGKFGPAASALIDESELCIAELLPEVLVPTAAVVDGETLVVTIQGNGVSTTGSNLSKKGSC
jgi:hypothetical protein